MTKSARNRCSRHCDWHTAYFGRTRFPERAATVGYVVFFSILISAFFHGERETEIYLNTVTPTRNCATWKRVGGCPLSLPPFPPFFLLSADSTTWSLLGKLSPYPNISLLYFLHASCNIRYMTFNSLSKI